MVLYDEVHGPLGLNGITEHVIRGRRSWNAIVWNLVGLPRLLKAGKIDVYHSLKLLSAPRSKVKMIFTIHSMSQFLYPDLWSKHQLAYWRWTARQCARRADSLIAVSEAEKRNIIEFTAVPANRVHVINLAAQERFRPRSGIDGRIDVRIKYGLPDRYILFVGNIYPFKNVEAIVRAFHNLVVNHKIPHDLVLAGEQQYRSQGVWEMIADLGIEERVVRTGFVTDDLPALYSDADLFVFPSYYEAFGLPPLEAMQSGVPVVCSNTGGIPEVVGDAALQVEPASVDGIASAMLRILSDSTLREHLVRKGFERAAAFSWDRCATETFALYELVSSYGSNHLSASNQGPLRTK